MPTAAPVDAHSAEMVSFERRTPPFEMRDHNDEATKRRLQAALLLGLTCLGLTGCIFERDHGRDGYGHGRAYYEHDHYRS